MTCLVLLLLVLGALLNTSFSSNQNRDYGYSMLVSACTDQQVAAMAKHELKYSFILSSSYLNGAYARISVLNPLFNLDKMFFFKNLELMLLLAGLGALAFRTRESLAFGRPLSKSFAFVRPLLAGLDKYYLAIAAVFFLHFMLVPVQLPYLGGLACRSTPFVLAFLLLALRVDSMHSLIRQAIPALLAALILVNAGYQAMLFVQHAPTQTLWLDKLANISAQLPDNSTVLVIPSNWTDAPNPMESAQAHYSPALLLVNPRIYVSGLFMYQDTFILRSSFPLYDDFTAFGPSPEQIREQYPNATISDCYQPIPKYYSYYIDENMTLHKNNNTALNQSPQ